MIGITHESIKLKEEIQLLHPFYRGNFTYIRSVRLNVTQDFFTAVYSHLVFHLEINANVQTYSEINNHISSKPKLPEMH